MEIFPSSGGCKLVVDANEDLWVKSSGELDQAFEGRMVNPSTLKSVLAQRCVVEDEAEFLSRI